MEISKEELVNNQEFHMSIQVSSKIIFNVAYYTLGSNKNANFTTSADEFNSRKTDYDRCGQAQESLLEEGTLVRDFYNKWDKLHLNDLNDRQYSAMIADLLVITDKHNIILTDNQYDSINFYDNKELSGKELKTKPKSIVKPKKNTVSVTKSAPIKV